MKQVAMIEETGDGAVGASQGATRRAVLAGAGAAAMAVLAGCATYDQTGGGGGDPALGGGGGDPAPAGPDGGGDKAAPLAQTGDIPVGGGKIFDRKSVVVTQPKEGTLVAFSAVCTHQGCTVAEVAGGTINCPCHGSRFKIADGSVAQGPAVRALRAVDIKVDGTTITMA